LFYVRDPEQEPSPEAHLSFTMRTVLAADSRDEF